MALNKPAWQSSVINDWGASRAVDGNANTEISAGSCTHTNGEDFPTWAVDLEVMTIVYHIEVMRRNLNTKRTRMSDPKYSNWMVKPNRLKVNSSVDHIKSIKNRDTKLMTAVWCISTSDNIILRTVLACRDVWYCDSDIFSTVTWMDNFYVAGSNQSFPSSHPGDILAAGYQLCGRYPGSPPVGQVSRVTCQPHPITTRYVYIQVDGRTSSSTLELCEVWVYGSKCDNYV